MSNIKTIIALTGLFKATVIAGGVYFYTQYQSADNSCTLNAPDIETNESVKASLRYKSLGDSATFKIRPAHYDSEMALRPDSVYVSDIDYESAQNLLSEFCKSGMIKRNGEMHYDIRLDRDFDL